MCPLNRTIRFDAICKKYEKYDVKKQRDLNISGEDAFARLYATVDIETTLQKVEVAKNEKNRAFVVAMKKALPDRIQAIPHGVAVAPKQTGGWAVSASRTNNIMFDSDGRFDDEYFQQTEESSQFRNEYEMRKTKQDQGLDMKSEGLDTLKNMAQDMNEEMTLEEYQKVPEEKRKAWEALKTKERMVEVDKELASLQ